MKKKQVNETKSRIAPRSSKAQKKVSSNAGPKPQKAPVAIGNRTYQSKPSYSSAGEKFVVRHCEYLGDIIGSASVFNIAKTISINPGLRTSFPWLNQIASRYESYHFTRLDFKFNTERPTTESGYVAIVPDYDPTDPAPLDKVTALQYESAAKSAPWENLIQVNRRTNLSKRSSYFVRQGVLSASENLGLYDSGNIFICVGGNSGNVVLGELWCDYEVVFETPQIDSNYGNDSMKSTGGGTLSGSNPMGTLPVTVFGRTNLGTWNNSSLFTFSVNYQGIFVIDLVGTSLVAVPVTGSATHSGGTVANAAATSSLTNVIVSALAGQTIQIGTVGATVTSAIVRVGNYTYSLG